MFNGNFFVEFDFKSYFFQFLLAPETRDLFSFRLAGTGGKCLRMCRLPMGYRAAPQVGQATAKALALEAVQDTKVEQVVWLDNILFSGKVQTEVRTVAERFRALCLEFSVTIGSEGPADAKGVALGLEWDLERRQRRMDPKWVEKVRPMTSVQMAEPQPLRIWWK